MAQNLLVDDALKVVQRHLVRWLQADVVANWPSGLTAVLFDLQFCEAVAPQADASWQLLARGGDEAFARLL